jgi:NitT/TauT family transport system substrate-binding protein
MESRRQFLLALTAATTTGLLNAHASAAAEAPPEITTIRFTRLPAVCLAPQYIAEELLRAEGFKEIRYVDTEAVQIGDAIARSDVDISSANPVDFAQALDAGAPIVVLGGLHVGCYELFAREGIHSISELKGRTVGLKASPPSQLILMAAQVGLDPKKDIRWITPADGRGDPLELFVQGKLDAFLGFAPEPQEVRSHRAGNVLVRTTSDRPWSQYFCCMLAANREFARQYPIATKRVMRALLKAVDLCASEPKRIARRVVDLGFTDSYDFALEALNDIPYDKWRDYDPEDTLRFYALRLHEAGLIRSSPQKSIAKGVEWRFLNDLKRELKT